ncbi:Rha family transcriptional regulator [Pseudomonas fulva]|uniref:Rha family transcriptional regulator n=1 Tax=Pseudomonas fulva TaxID=47880 RepID=UPI001F0D30EB|nr:Rha family transcriptional regulator [Pseudomonas fulva]
MSSREIADLVEARHNDVVSTIERLFAKNLLRSSRKSRREATGGRPIEVYDLIERDTHLVVAGYSDEHRARVIDRWQELESNKSQPLPANFAESLRALAEQVEANERISQQLDHAVATKAEIGSRREATAMATASAAVKRANQLEAELGRNTRHATVTAVESALGIHLGKQGFRPLKKYCKDNGITPEKVPCPRYGQVVAWPAAAWDHVYSINLSVAFGGAA